MNTLHARHHRRIAACFVEIVRKLHELATICFVGFHHERTVGRKTGVIRPVRADAREHGFEAMPKGEMKRNHEIAVQAVRRIHNLGARIDAVAFQPRFDLVAFVKRISRIDLEPRPTLDALGAEILEKGIRAERVDHGRPIFFWERVRPVVEELHVRSANRFVCVFADAGVDHGTKMRKRSDRALTQLLRETNAGNARELIRNFANGHFVDLARKFIIELTTQTKASNAQIRIRTQTLDEHAVTEHSFRVSLLARETVFFQNPLSVEIGDDRQDERFPVHRFHPQAMRLNGEGCATWRMDLFDVDRRQLARAQPVEIFHGEKAIQLIFAIVVPVPLDVFICVFHLRDVRNLFAQSSDVDAFAEHDVL